MAITLQCKEAKITPTGFSNNRMVVVELDLNLSEVLQQLNPSIKEIIDCLSINDLLEELGQQVCEDHFDLEPRLDGVKAAIKAAHTQCPHCGESLTEES